jgi:putative sigma-54 modulation protein
MIKKLDINAVHLDLDPKLKSYVSKKVGRLDRYIPRHARESAHAEVFLKERKIKGKKECICEVVLQLPQDTITLNEATVNMYAAVDIVEAKLKNQLKKYKDTHGVHGLHRRVLSRLKRTPVQE